MSGIVYPTEYPRISMMYMIIRRMMAKGIPEKEIEDGVIEFLTKEDEHGNLREG